MLLEDITKPAPFRVDGFEYSVVEIYKKRMTIKVTDPGHLQVGEFYINFADNDVNFVESPNFPHTLERMRKAGNSNEIARAAGRMIDTILK